MASGDGAHRILSESTLPTLDGSTFDGTTDGLEENGALRVKTLGGSVRIVQAGDVERQRITPVAIVPGSDILT